MMKPNGNNRPTEAPGTNRKDVEDAKGWKILVAFLLGASVSGVAVNRIDKHFLDKGAKRKVAEVTREMNGRVNRCQGEVEEKGKEVKACGGKLKKAKATGTRCEFDKKQAVKSLRGSISDRAAEKRRHQNSINMIGEVMREARKCIGLDEPLERADCYNEKIYGKVKAHFKSLRKRGARSGRR